MQMCFPTIGISIVIFVASAFGFRFGGVKVGSIAGGLGAVVLILGLLGTGC